MGEHRARSSATDVDGHHGLEMTTRPRMACGALGCAKTQPCHYVVVSNGLSTTVAYFAWDSQATCIIAVIVFEVFWHWPNIARPIVKV